MIDRRRLLGVVVLVLGGCGETEAPGNPIPIGLLLSYSGDLAANSINSERALLMALEAANQAGGVSGRQVSMVARDSRSDPRRVGAAAQELIDAGAAVFVGPDTPDLAVELKDRMRDRTLLMPSFTTSSNFAKPNSWFVMGAPASRVACEIKRQLDADHRMTPLVVADPNGYSSLLAYLLSQTYGYPWVFLPADQASNETSVKPITDVPADAYVLAALPPSAASLLYTMAAVGALGEPDRWYLSPTLHTPALLETVPKGMLRGAHGVAAVPMGAPEQEFQTQFRAHWQDEPLDDAYAFYDAGAVVVLALQRALVEDGAIPTGTELAAHIVAVTAGGHQVIGWNHIDEGLALLQQGQDVSYSGLTGPLKFDLSGQTQLASTVWWRVGADGFETVARPGDCH
jgi:ABC-type branched-subunit amino acid transport system substrate-binding protein